MRHNLWSAKPISLRGVIKEGRIIKVAETLAAPTDRQVNERRTEKGLELAIAACRG